MRLFLALLLFPFVALAQKHEGRELVQATLVADTAAIAPGKTFTVGLRLRMAPGWHTYWEYAGDAGLPTRINWSLPPGFTAGQIRWPMPEHHIEPGDIQTYGYDGETMLLVEITPPAQIGAEKVTLQAKATWLVCEKICIPGSAELSLELPVGEPQPTEAELFAKYRAQLPQPLPAEVKVEWTFDEEAGRLRVTGLTAEQAKAIEYFPLPPKGLTVGHPEVSPANPRDERLAAVSGVFSSSAVEIQIPGKLTEPINGLLVTGDDDTRTGWQLAETPKETAAPVPIPQPASTNSQSILLNLFLAFLGGIILNIMPCVLPVIALKLFGFIQQAGDEPGRVFRMGLAFTAGVFAFFLALAGLISAFQVAGRQLSWGFQFQNSWFILGVSVLVFVFGLNLLGVFEVFLPGKVGTAASGLSRREGYGGAFFQGTFATLLGTSCTAPLLAPALGFALTQPPVVIFAIFAAVAAGMSLPFIVLTARPGWMRWLPRPGAWMERAKQFMGFLMLATLLWLLWIIGRQRGADAIIWASAFLLVVGIAAWVKGAFATPVAAARTRAVGWAAIVALVAAGWLGFITNGFAHASAPATGSFAAKLEAARTEGAVFVDFTADWCLNCKVNERLVLDTDVVQGAFEEHGVNFLVADWTSGDEEITALLRQFGRAGVPLYVFYPADGGAPVVLPEVLTKQMVIDTVKSAPGSDSPRL